MRQTLTMLMLLIWGIVGAVIQIRETGNINIVSLVILIITIGYFTIGFIEEGVGMFNWFGKREYPKVPQLTSLPDPKDYPPMPRVEEPVDNSDGYTVGVDCKNNTVMRINYDYGTTTLTMTPDGVRQMIRLLEATLPKDGK